MKLFRTLTLAILAVAAVSCSRSVAHIEGSLAGIPDQNVVVKQLSTNTFQVLDTVRTDDSGHFAYDVEVAEGQPEFIYLYFDDTKFASLLLQKGDNVSVNLDDEGHSTVEGSEESLKLQKVEDDFQDFVYNMTHSTDGAEMSRTYIDYYRKCVKYILANPKSLTSMQVLYQKLNDDFPIFSQATDALHFRTVYDSLSVVYPESEYVKALRLETERREQIMNLNSVISTAPESGYPDFALPDNKGRKVKLSEVEARVILLHFWSSTENAQTIFNTDTLLPIYEEFHDRGLEIVSVSLDTDKAHWASVVKNQKLPWINLCDGRGTACPAVVLYNLEQIPTTFVIADGSILDAQIGGLDALRKELNKLLK